MTLTLTLPETLPGWTRVRVSSFVSIGPAVWPAIRNKQTDKHIAFYYIDKRISEKSKIFQSSVFLNLYKTIVKPHLEYANQVWFPKRVSDVDRIERVQKRATKIVIRGKELPYEERLRLLNLPTLHYRRIRGDMIELYKGKSTISEQPQNLTLLCKIVTKWLV